MGIGIRQNIADDPGQDDPLAQSVLNELLRGIAEGDYRPGERVNASRVGEKLKLSAAPVREALHILSGSGIVKLHRNRGAILREMSFDDVLDFCAVLCANAILPVEMAAQRIHLGDNRAIMQAEMSNLKSNATMRTAFDFYTSSNSYHEALNSISNNPFIDSFMNRYLIAYWGIFLNENLPILDFADDFIQGYQRLTDAIVVGDSRSAKSIWQYHSEWTIAVLKGEHASPGTPWIR